MIVEELYALLGFKVEGDEGIKRFTGGLQKATSALGAFAARAAIFAAAAATTIGAGVAALGKSSISVGAQFEDLSAILETIEGSSEKAKSSLGWVEEFATKTPYDLKQVADAFVRLKANGLEPQSGLLESIGNASSAMGKDLMSGVEMMADAVRGESERLKEFGVVASKAGEQITYSWSQNGKTMTKTVRNDAAEIQKALQSIFDSRFLGAMEKRSTTFNGIVANIGDIWTGFLRRIADAGWFEWVKGQFSSFLQTLQVFIEDGTMDRLAKKISDTLVETGEAVKGLFKGFSIDDVASAIAASLRFLSGAVSFIKTIGQGVAGIGRFAAKLLDLGAAWKGILVVLGTVGMIVAPWKTAFVGLVLVVEDFVKFLNGGKSAIGKLLESIEELFASWGVEIDLSPDGVKGKLNAFAEAFQDFQGKLGLALAGIALFASRLGKVLGGMGKGFGAIPIFRIFLVGAAISTLMGSFGDVRSISDFTEALTGLSALDWGVIAGGALTLVGPLTKLSGAIAGVVGQLGLLKVLTSLGGLATLAGLVGAKALIDSGPADPSLVDPRRAPEKGNAYRNRQRYNNSFEGGMHRAGAERDMPAVEQKTEAKPFSLRQMFQDLWAPIPSQRGAGETKAESAVPAKVGDLLQSIASAASKIESVTGTRSTEKVVETVSNDNRVDARTFNAPVSIKATITNGTPEQIGAAAGRAVRHSMGDPAVRALAITANPGGIGR
jgi:hypothetical protein